MKKTIFVSLAALTLLFTGCSTKEYKLFQQEGDKDEITTVVPDDVYKEEVKFENIIAPNDRINVTVYIQSSKGNQQMSSILTSNDGDSDTVQENVGSLVTQKGTIRLPLIGSVDVSGYTTDEAADMLIKEYKKYIRNPYVVVSIQNQRIVVMGEVGNPGVVSVTNGTMNVLEAIARSGDLTDMASRSDIKVLRGDLRNPEIRVIDLTSMNALSMSSLYLKPNDVVYVQPRNLKAYNQAFEDVVPFWAMLSAILDPFALRKTIIE